MARKAGAEKLTVPVTPALLRQPSTAGCASAGAASFVAKCPVIFAPNCKCFPVLLHVRVWEVLCEPGASRPTHSESQGIELLGNRVMAGEGQCCPV